MSRVGKKPIQIPNGVSIIQEDNIIRVEGPKGTLTQDIVHPILFEVQENEVFVTPGKDQVKNMSAFWGLYRALLQNMITGVTEGFTKKLRIEGVGYRVALQGDTLVLNLGYSHPIEVKAPEGISFEVEKNIISVKGIDKALVGQVSANIRSTRPPEPYKGKGVRYDDEFVRMKVGKKTSS
jgi:large subunit ribosomal protein L6